MSGGLILKIVLIWVLFAILAIFNGLLREFLITPLAGSSVALPLSGILLALMIFIATWLVFPVIGRHPARIYIVIGSLWVLMTLLFEFGLGHYVSGKSLEEILQVFHIQRGNLFLLALVSSFVSPLLVAKLKNG